MRVSPDRKKQSRIKLLKGFFPISICFFLLNGGTAWGSARQFIPRYVSFAGNLQVNSLYETDSTETTVSSSSSSDFTSIESLNLRGAGYIYSPFFISMQTSVGLGLKQERISTAGGQTRSFGKDSTTFMQEFKILPTHPYNLELYFKRSTPLVGGRTGQSGSLVTDEYGVRAVYTKRPWATDLTYINYQAESPTSEVETQSLNYTLSYFQDDFNALGRYTHNQTSRDSEINEGSDDQYAISMTKFFDKIRLTGRWNRDKQENDEIVRGVAVNSVIKRRKLHGSINVDLPMNFKSTLSYNSNNRDDRRNQSGTERFIFNDSQNYNFLIHHRLFKSLRTSFNSTFSNNDSTGGETSQQSYRVRGDYSKKMRWGKVLTGLWYGLANLDSKGAPITLEPHEIDTTLNFFDLSNPNVNPNTIEVRIRDHNNNNRLVLLTEGVHYDVDPTPDQISFRITITNLPPDLISPVNIWEYSYLVNFAVLEADYVIRTINSGGSLALPLFNELITPHYSYADSRQKELEGNFPGDPADSKTHDLGLSFYKNPFRGDMTLTWLRSNTRSEDQLIAYINYRTAFTPFTSGNMTVTYEDRNTRQNDPPADLNEKNYSAQTQIQTIFPQKNLTASITANYALLKGTGDTRSLALFSTLGWRLGRIDLYISAYYTNSETENGGFTTKRQNTSVKMELKRELF